MKRNLLLFILLFFFGMTGFTQNLVITEINYNDPSGGNSGDTLEYIELYNNTIEAINMSAYQFTAGITYTFPAGSLINPQQYIIIAKDTAIFRAFYNLEGSVYQWNTGQALSNQGEAIVLKDSNGLLLDSVRYYTTSPWPVTAAGNGPSMMLCDPSLDNNVGSNWIAATPQNSVIFGIVNNLTVFGTPFQGCVVTPPYVPVFASFPYTQSFDALWINGDYYRDVPDNHFKSTPSNGNNSWRRDNDGSTAGWTFSTNGAYTPAGANGTANSARFHSAGATANTAGNLDLYINLNTPGAKKLNFWYINTNGNDSLSIYISQDNGLTFNLLGKFTNTTTWEFKSVILGYVNSPQTLLRFRAVAATTTSDIGIDEISFSLIPPDDAGVVEITSPPATMPGLTDTVRVIIRNFGSDTLTNVTIGWSVNGLIQTPLQYNDTVMPLSNSGEIELGQYVFTSGVISVIKAWTSLPNLNPDPEPLNDTLAKSVFYQPYATFPFYEGFDSTWINKLSNHDVPSIYWTNEPVTGSNSWRRDDDGASAAWTNAATGAYTPAGADGTIHSARFHTGGSTGGQTGALYAYVNLNTPGNKELRFWHINTAGQDSLAVWLSTDGGNTFSFLAKWSVQATWAERVISLGNISSPTCVFRFRTTANNNGNTDVGLDEVSIGLALPDAAVTKIVSPVSDCQIPANTNIVVRVKNAGNTDLINIPLNTNAGAFVIPDTLNPGDSIDFTAGTITIPVGTNAIITAYTSYPNDASLLNDTLRTTVKSFMPVSVFPFLENFETGSTPYFNTLTAANSTANIVSGVGNDGTYGLQMTGKAAGTWPQGTSQTTTYAQAFGYTDHLVSAYSSCMVDATSLVAPELLLDLRQGYSSGWAYSYFRVLVNDTIVLTSLGNKYYFNPVTQTADTFVTHRFDLVPFAGTKFKLTFQGALKSNAANAMSQTNDEAVIDNIIIKEKPAIDAVLSSLTSPVSNCGLNQETVTVKISNYGANPLMAIPVYYKINSGAPVNEIINDTLNSGQSMTYSFVTLANLTATGPYAIEAGVQYPGDLDSTNNIVTSDVYNTPVVSVFPYLEDFENTINGWSSGAVAGVNEWVLGTPAKPAINTAHSGVNTWVTGLTANYSDNTNNYIISPCFDLTSLANPVLSVWLRLKTELNYDAMILEASQNGGAWQKVTGTGFYNNNSNQGNLPAPKWSGNNGEWTKYTATIYQFGGMSQVQFRFRFNSDNMDNDEGVAIDDFSIFPASPDLAVTTINSPVSGCELTSAEPVEINVRNMGQLPAYGMVLRYSVDNLPYVYDTITDTLNTGTPVILTHIFSVPANLSAGGYHNIVAGVYNASDPFHDNDSVESVVLNTLPITNPPVSTDFETTTYLQYIGFVDYDNSRISVPNGVGAGGGHAAVMTGGANSNWQNGTGNTTTINQAFNYSDHLSTIYTCDVSLTPSQAWFLTFDMRQTYNEGPKHCWARVMMNDAEYLSDVPGDSVFNPITQDSDVYMNHIFMLDPSLSPMRLSIQASCRNDEINASSGIADKVYIDNLAIDFFFNINEIGEFGVMLYPNPATDQLNLQFAGDIRQAQLELRSVTGQLLLTRIIANTKLEQIDLKTLPAGVYTISVRNDYNVRTMKFIKQ